MKFRYKMTLCIICISAVLFAIGGTLLLSISFEKSIDKERETAQKNYVMLRSTLGLVNSFEKWDDADGISNVLSELLKQNTSPWSGVRLLSRNGNIYQNGVKITGEPSFDTDYLKITSIASENGRRYQKISNSFNLGDNLLCLETLHDVTDIYTTRSEQQEILYLVLIVITVLSGVLSYIISWLLTRPLKKLSKAAGEIANGNLSYRTEVRSNDDIGDLSREFDKMAEKLEKSTEELLDAVERQQQFMGSFTHELKTPMASIIGYSDLLRTGSLNMEEQAEAANYIFIDARRLEKLSGKLLSIFVADNDTITLSRVSPLVLIGRVADSVRPSLLKHNIKLSINCQKGVCLLDPDLCWSLLTNLIDNAQKAMPNGGTIRLSSKMTKSGCAMSISDEGIGIPPKALQHITEAFYRVDKSRSRALGGAGLGLSLCAKIISLHKGELHFESEEGKGTRVSFTLNGGRP